MIVWLEPVSEKFAAIWKIKKLQTKTIYRNKILKLSWGKSLRHIVRCGNVLMGTSGLAGQSWEHMSPKKVILGKRGKIQIMSCFIKSNLLVLLKYICYIVISSKKLKFLSFHVLNFQDVDYILILVMCLYPMEWNKI